MSTTTIKSRFRPRYEARKHSKLCTVQRRLRHLTSISGRNIDPNLFFSRRVGPKSNLLNLYFTIHAENDEKIVLYTSEIIENTLNPNWREFDYKVFKEHPTYLHTSSVVIYVWGSRKNSKYVPIIRCLVSFSGLVYSKDQLRSYNPSSYEQNSILFGMFDGYYTAPTFNNQGTTSTQTDINTKSSLHQQKQNLMAFEDDNITAVTKAAAGETNDKITLSDTIDAEASSICTSYQKSSLMRVFNSMKAIHQTTQQVNKVKNEMDHLIARNEHRKHKCAHREKLIFKNNLLRLEWEKLKQKLSVEKHLALQEKEDILHRKEELNKRRDHLEQCRCDIKESYSTYIGRREMLLKVRTHLSFRRRQLAAELSYIYPIIEVKYNPSRLDAELSYIYPIIELPVSEDNKKEFTISGVPLPNSEDFLGKDDAMLAVAIGNVAHLVYMMAKFLELPLRYPIKPMGSRSSVADLVIDKLTDKQREFPLYLKGKEKYYFHYGVFLLNKNIAQLRYHSGLGTADLRNTLINLKNLLEVKFGVRIVVKKDSGVFNKANLLSGRPFSLPYTTSPQLNFDHHHQPNNHNSKAIVHQDLINDKPERSRSGVVTGLPDVHVKSHQQHKFLIRNSTARKTNTSPNSVDKNNTDNLIDLEEDSASSSSTQQPKQEPEELLDIPFEEVVSRTIGGDFAVRNIMIYEHQEGAAGGSSSALKEGELIDFGEDCLNGDTSSGEVDYFADDAGETESRNLLSRQVSDALIIPDAFERQQEANLSPSETVMV